MIETQSPKVGPASRPGEYDSSMLTLLQFIWDEGFLSPGGAQEVARLLEGSDGPQVASSHCRAMAVRLPRSTNF